MNLLDNLKILNEKWLPGDVKAQYEPHNDMIRITYVVKHTFPNQDWYLDQEKLAKALAREYLHSAHLVMASAIRLSARIL